MWLSRFRKTVDTHLPLLGSSYRALREIKAARPQKTAFGFNIAGAPEMASGYEDIEISFFLASLEKHDVVLDIGANVGLYSCLASSRGMPVVAFEPSPRNLKFLYSNLWNNNFTSAEVFPMGLGDRCELRPIYGFGGISSFIPGWGQAQKSSFYVVPVTTLDTVLGSRFAGKRLLIKMDVEGFESDVLRGASGILDATPHPTWLLEIMFRNPLIPGGINPRFEETFEAFWRYGYRCTTAGASRRDVSRADVMRWTASGQVESLEGNFVFYL